LLSYWVREKQSCLWKSRPPDEGKTLMHDLMTAASSPRKAAEYIFDPDTLDGLRG